MAGAHRPDPGRIVPTATYRLQVHAGFGFDAAAERTAYLASLGVSHLYLSPVLQAAPGSEEVRSYDVLDHTRIGGKAAVGREAFQRLVTACREAGLGIIVDVVPNHMTVPEPDPPQRAVLVAAARRPPLAVRRVVRRRLGRRGAAHPDAGARRHRRAGDRAR